MDKPLKETMDKLRKRHKAGMDAAEEQLQRFMTDTALSEYRDAVKEKSREFLRSKFMSDEFLDFMERNMAPYEEALAYYRCAVMEVETKFRVLNEQFSLRYDNNPIESIKTRIKSNDSLIRKVRRKNLPMDIDVIMEEITDIAGVRVICSFQEDIYRLADSLIRQDDIRLLQCKDYIKHPKPSGYRSLHLIVEVPIYLENEKRSMKVEVQLRTIAMDFWASLEHKLRYKKEIAPEVQERLSSELVACAEQIASLDERMQEIRDRLTEA